MNPTFLVPMALGYDGFPGYDPRPSSSRTKGAAFTNAKLAIHERDRKRLERERQRRTGGSR